MLGKATERKTTKNHKRKNCYLPQKNLLQLDARVNLVQFCAKKSSFLYLAGKIAKFRARTNLANFGLVLIKEFGKNLQKHRLLRLRHVSYYSRLIN